jgi:hypothetical protein
MIKHVLIISLLSLQVIIAQEPVSENKKWSLGITYQPNETTQYPYFYTIIDFGGSGSIEPTSGSFIYYPYYYSNSKTSIHFTRAIFKNIWAYLSFTYSSDDIYDRREQYVNYDSDNDVGSGHENTIKTNSISIFAGGKIYFTSPKPKSVSPYIVLGIGKRLTDYARKNVDLFEDEEDNSINNDNFNEYYEKINSPFYLFGKGGTEYFFNSSLSVSAELEFLYEKEEGDYKSTNIYYDNYGNIYYTSSSSRKNKKSTINQSALFGLNFYF